jgi:hypothetical protein
MGNGASSIYTINNAATKRPIVFIDFDKFKTYGSIPRNPDCELMCVTMANIDRDNSVVMFVSHVWFLGMGETPIT